jgi:glyoxylase-like metal-dependent hydrolase (beta-lactamase superfamily II)
VASIGLIPEGSGERELDATGWWSAAESPPRSSETSGRRSRRARGEENTMTRILRWQVGDVKITRVQEWEGSGLRFLLPDATQENLAAIDWIGPFVNEQGKAVASVHSLVLEVGSRRIVVDTCIGNDKQRMPMKNWHMLQGPFLSDLEEAGFAPPSIDTVVCTHLHTDHVGWNTTLVEDRWVPTFQNARTLISNAEWDHWRESDMEAMRPTLEDSVQPLFDADLVDLVAVDHEVAEGIHFEHTPGHTPGHSSVHIRSRGEEAVITGDIFHHPAQIAALHWKNTADEDPAQADATRRSFLDRYSDTPTLIIGTHFAGPTAGRLVRDGDAYRLDA